MRNRPAVVLTVLACVAFAASAFGLDAGAATPTTTPTGTLTTQTLVGGGTGIYGVFARWPTWFGSYSSTSQLGTGSYRIGPMVSVRFTRSDGVVLDGFYDWQVPDTCGTHGPDVECIRVDLVGTADIASAHLVIAITEPTRFDRFGEAPAGFLMRGTISLRRKLGYAMVDSGGTVSTFGGVDHLGDAHTADATDVKLTPSHDGYWIVNAAGQVFAFGDAVEHGSVNATTLSAGERVTSMSVTPTGKGYWLFTSIGRSITFGDAQFFGDLRVTPLTGPIVGSVATPTGHGYYMVGSDGGVFAFGDARFHGSMGATRLNQPVVGLTPTPDNRGYWLVAADGGVFSFHARFYGSMGGTRLVKPVVTMVPSGPAYMMIASDGGVFTFAKAPFFGSKGGTPLAAPIVNGAATG